MKPAHMLVRRIATEFKLSTKMNLFIAGMQGGGGQTWTMKKKPAPPPNFCIQRYQPSYRDQP